MATDDIEQRIGSKGQLIRSVLSRNEKGVENQVVFVHYPSFYISVMHFSHFKCSNLFDTTGIFIKPSIF